MQKQDKFGVNNPHTVNFFKHFKMENETLKKYIINSLPLKGKLFTRKKLH